MAQHETDKGGRKREWGREAGAGTSGKGVGWRRAHCVVELGVVRATARREGVGENGARETDTVQIWATACEAPPCAN